MATFHAFCRFPQELRLLVWEHALPDPCIVPIVRNTLHPRYYLKEDEESAKRVDNSRVFAGYKSAPLRGGQIDKVTPILFRTCHESRKVALQAYQKAFFYTPGTDKKFYKKSTYQIHRGGRMTMPEDTVVSNPCEIIAPPIWFQPAKDTILWWEMLDDNPQLGNNAVVSYLPGLPYLPGEIDAFECSEIETNNIRSFMGRLMSHNRFRHLAISSSQPTPGLFNTMLELARRLKGKHGQSIEQLMLLPDSFVAREYKAALVPLPYIIPIKLPKLKVIGACAHSFCDIASIKLALEKPEMAPLESLINPKIFALERYVLMRHINDPSRDIEAILARLLPLMAHRLDIHQGRDRTGRARWGLGEILEEDPQSLDLLDLADV